MPGPAGRGATNPAEGYQAHRRNGKLRVLLANDPRAYRESIAAVFHQPRPEALKSSVSRFPPDVAICSRVTGEVRDLVTIWVELYPAHSVASERGRQTEFSEIQLGDLLSIVDRASGVAQAWPSLKGLVKFHPFS